MRYRTLGRTGIRVPEIGFGCGNVGGMMVRGTHEQQVSAVRGALALGIDYFDTAPSYGDELSERHLGEVLAELKPAVHVATKFRVTPDDLRDIPGAIRRSLEGSLRRLQRDAVDVLQLHTNLSTADEPGIGAAEVLAPGGVAVLSGLLESQDRAVINGHRSQGLALRRRIAIDGWHSLVLVKPDGGKRGRSTF